MSGAQKSLNKACIKKPFKPFEKLEKNVQYQVEQFMIKESTHGERIKVDFSDFWVFLPVRFYEALKGKGQIEQLNSGPTMYMTYHGKDYLYHNR